MMVKDLSSKTEQAVFLTRFIGQKILDQLGYTFDSGDY
jgi:hypothetical protein